MRAHRLVARGQDRVRRIGRDAVVDRDVESASASFWRIGSTSPSFTSTASVMIITRLDAGLSDHRAQADAEPGPTNAVGRGIAIRRDVGYCSGFAGGRRGGFDRHGHACPCRMGRRAATRPFRPRPGRRRARGRSSAPSGDRPDPLSASSIATAGGAPSGRRGRRPSPRPGSRPGRRVACRWITRCTSSLAASTLDGLDLARRRGLADEQALGLDRQHVRDRDQQHADREGCRPRPSARRRSTRRVRPGDREGEVRPAPVSSSSTTGSSGSSSAG